MNIRRQEENQKGQFYIEKDGKSVAQMQYKWDDKEKLVITHTNVDESMQNQGLGGQLVQKAVDFAREEGIKLSSECSFAKSVLSENENFSDVFEP